MNEFTNDPSDLGQRFEKNNRNFAMNSFFFELNAAGESNRKKENNVKSLQVKKSGSFSSTFFSRASLKQTKIKNREAHAKKENWMPLRKSKEFLFYFILFPHLLPLLSENRLVFSAIKSRACLTKFLKTSHTPGRQRWCKRAEVRHANSMKMMLSCMLYCVVLSCIMWNFEVGRDFISSRRIILETGFWSHSLLSWLARAHASKQEWDERESGKWSRMSWTLKFPFLRCSVS